MIKTICKYPGCIYLSLENKVYCESHEKEMNKYRIDIKYKQSKRIKNKYGKNWKNISKQWREDNPLCRKCGNNADVTDHIIPVVEGGTNDKWNLQSLCHKCHVKKTRRDYIKRNRTSYVDIKGRIIPIDKNNSHEKYKY